MTNGTGLTPALAVRLYTAGLNMLVVDCYNRATAQRVRAVGGKVGVPAQLYGVDQVNPWTNYGSRGYRLVLVDDMAIPDKPTRRMYSRCGAVPPAVYPQFGITPVMGEPLARMCVKPWRHLMVHYDGRIPLCCMDWVARRVFGNVREIDDLSAWWTSNEELKLVRRALLRKDRRFAPCDKCDYPGGQRVGLVDKEGLL
jgi:hypothetical protein